MTRDSSVENVGDLQDSSILNGAGEVVELGEKRARGTRAEDTRGELRTDVTFGYVSYGTKLPKSSFSAQEDCECCSSSRKFISETSAYQETRLDVNYVLEFLK